MLSQSCTHGPAVFTGTEADALRIVFMTGHADSAAYGGLFRTCRAGRDWVLTTAPHAHLTLQLADEQLTGDRWQRQLQATQGALVTRAQVQTDAHITTGLTISLEVPYSQYSAHIPLRDPDTYSTAVQTAGNSLISFIQQAGQYVSTLRVEQLNRAPAFVPTFLQRAATGLVSLTSLVLVECPCVLPLPSQLPHLTHFSYSPPDQDTSRDAMYTHTHVNGPPCKIARHTTTTTQQEKPAPTTTQHHPPPAHSTTTTSQHQELDVSWEEGVFRNSIARMLPQLTRFCFESGDVRDTGVLVDILRSCTGPFLRLTELFTPPLDDNLLGVVLDMCTSVRRLEVASVLVASAQYRGRQWGVQELAVCSLFEEPYDEYDYDAHTAVMCALALLPGASHGALAVGSGVAGVRARHRLRVVRPGLPCVLETETDSLLLVAHDKKGFPAAFAERLQDWSFAVPDIALAPHTDLYDYGQHTAMRAMLQQLRTLDAPGAAVKLGYWGDKDDWFGETNYNWTDRLDKVLYDALPSLSHLNITVPEVVDFNTNSEEWETDEDEDWDTLSN